MINKDLVIIMVVIAIVLVLTIGIVLYYFWGAQSETVATYDGGKITRGEFELYYRSYANVLSYYGYPLEYIPDYILDKMFIDELILAKAIEEGYKISDESKAEVDEIFANEENLTSIKSNGINPEKLKELYYNDSIITDYIEKMTSNVTTEQVKQNIIAEEGEKADLNLYKTSHILFAFEAEMTDEAKAKLLTDAQAMLKKIQAGEDFAKLATENSDDSATATDGGKFDMVNNDTVMSEYRDEVLKLKEGQLSSKIVKTDYGYHIIKLNKIVKNGRIDFASEVDSYIDSMLSKIQEEANTSPKENRIKSLAEKMNAELGLVEQNDQQ